jgi:hypothetical protein
MKVLSTTCSRICLGTIEISLSKRLLVVPPGHYGGTTEAPR